MVWGEDGLFSSDLLPDAYQIDQALEFLRTSAHFIEIFSHPDVNDAVLAAQEVVKHSGKHPLSGLSAA